MAAVSIRGVIQRRFITCGPAFPGKPHSVASVREKIFEIARTLPPTPRVFSDLDRLLRTANSGLEEVGGVIKRDSSLAGHVIRVGNSVAYGGEQKTGSVEEAVARIGMQEIFRIVGEVAGARLAERALRFYGIESADLREHMLYTAFVCESFALECRLDQCGAYTAGLLRPLGLLIVDRLADSYPQVEPYHPAHDKDYLAWEARTFGLSSCEVAAMVLAQWEFPGDIVEGVRNQYLLRSDDLSNRVASLLNIASSVAANDGYGLPGETRHWGGNVWERDALGLTEASFLTAATRGRAAFSAFQRRLRGEATTGGTRPPIAGQKGALAVDRGGFPTRTDAGEPPARTAAPAPTLEPSAVSLAEAAPTDRRAIAHEHEKAAVSPAVTTSPAAPPWGKIVFPNLQRWPWAYPWPVPPAWGRR